jgi:mRNA-binding protein PUF3
MLSRHATGCHIVQEAIDQAESDEERQSLAMELKGRVVEAVGCPHANHVLQKFITTLGPQALEFILSELLVAYDVTAMARHKYGCRVLQRLLEHCREDQLELLEKSLLPDTISLCGHKFGNYVIQHLLEHGRDASREALVALLVRHVSKLASDNTAISVLNKAFDALCKNHCHRLAMALQSHNGLLVRLCRSRRGHQVVKVALQHLPRLELQRAVSQVLQAEEFLSVSRYGRSVITICKGNYVEK